jgi:hypothetical protein
MSCSFSALIRAVRLHPVWGNAQAGARRFCVLELGIFAALQHETVLRKSYRQSKGIFVQRTINF